MISRFSFAALLCCVLGGCNASSGPDASATAAMPDVLPTRATARETASSDYLVSPQDVLEVSVYQVPSLNRTVQVDGSGRITLPLVGVVQAAGKTTHDLELLIAQRFGSRYLKDPQVAVFLKDAVGQRVTVDGAVREPGIFQTKGSMTLTQAIAQAKGLNEVGDPSGVLVFRVVDGQRVGARFDLAAIRAGRMPDPALEGGDTVVIDESGTRTAWKTFREALPIAAFAPALGL